MRRCRGQKRKKPKEEPLSFSEWDLSPALWELMARSETKPVKELLTSSPDRAPHWPRFDLHRKTKHQRKLDNKIDGRNPGNVSSARAPMTANTMVKKKIMEYLPKRRYYRGGELSSEKQESLQQVHLIFPHNTVTHQVLISKQLSQANAPAVQITATRARQGSPKSPGTPALSR
ncbi:hypothetical protein TNCV_1667191 [Trichonephila clavipes]|nr:hypothetical protein TNCV_1667191 [Trichonephila clavipes]